MRNAILICLLVFLCAGPMTAQLSTRTGESSVIRTGTRPEAGDFGVFLSPSFANFQEISDENVDVRGLPFVNVKYYKDDNLEYRCGIQVYKTRTKLKGDLVDPTGSGSSRVPGLMLERDMCSFFRLSPGIAYHASPKNLFDVYAGAAIPFGTEREAYETKSGTDDNYSYSNTTKNTFVIGYDFYLGLQVFIADLPVSVGIEYGIMGLKHLGLSYKHEIETKSGSTVNSQTYYTRYENSSTTYEKLKYKSYEVGSDVKITVSYYFTR